MLNVWRACLLIIKKGRLPVALLFGYSRYRVYIDYRASPFSCVALDRLVSVPLSYCAPTIRGRGRGRLVPLSAQYIMGSYLTTTKAQLFKLSIECSEIQL